MSVSSLISLPWQKGIYRAPEKLSENSVLGLFSNQCQFVIVSLQLTMQQQDQPSRVARRPFTRLLEGVVFTLSGFQGSYSIKNILAYVN